MTQSGKFSLPLSDKTGRGKFWSPSAVSNSSDDSGLTPVGMVWRAGNLKKKVAYTLRCFEVLRIHLPWQAWSIRNLNIQLYNTKIANQVNLRTTYRKKTFAYNAPPLWNTLPLHIRTEKSLDSFKKALKTLLFQDTYKFKAKAYIYNWNSQMQLSNVM